ncbi:hypothetical protein CLV84_0230 [Neolewinella xylanilytica]|uniref:Tetratricopeptide repeat protein n=1 Tax=Neolewinella xylanilytica TaxID=1514080 RepID=A0A2S6I6Z5_9BACT|nr:hypothetical protein [Neolewinella xylanilytica]PPK87292.1 hypothetical protein CLV84_0230 [Neolewinella xylanilytica]
MKYVLTFGGLFYMLSLFGRQGQCAMPVVGDSYRFLNPRVVGYDSELAPFFLHFGTVYRDELEQPGDRQRNDNVAEWHERFCDQAEPEAIDAIIYGNNLNQLQELRRLLNQPEAKTGDLPPGLRSNSFAHHLLEANCVEVLEYLIYAKQAEPFVTAPTNAFDAPSPDRSEMEDLLKRGVEAFPRVESHYVRLRYAYQLIRLAHYLKAYDYVLELYAYLMPKIDADPSIIYDWIEGHRAGALQSLGNYAESAYLYSRIFERTPSKRESAYRSFRIRTNEQWREALLLAQNDHERAMLHVLRAHNGKAIVVDEMRDIYGYEPDNRSLQLLTMRELQELEASLLASRVQSEGPDAEATDRLVELQAFVNRVLEEDKVADRDFWKLARGVLEMLAGDYFFAEETFTELAATTESDTIRQQIGILEEVLDVLELNRVTDSVELHYYDLLTDATLQQRYPDFQPFVNAKLQSVYRRTGKEAKADLIRYGFDAIQKNPTIESILALERMADSLNRNRFDRALLTDRIGPNPVDHIYNLLGNHYVQQGQWKAALEIYRRIDPNRIDDFGRYSPFIRQINDRVEFTPPADAPTYNKVQLLDRLDELEEEADRTTNDTIAARNYFNIGQALYTMSYFGYNWSFADEFRSGSSAARAAAAREPREVFSHPYAPLGNRESLDMGQARYYFERAMRRAPDRESAATAAYFAAKTERNRHYALGRPGGERPFTYFGLIRDNYSDTDFYDQLIAECKTFAWYVNR